MIPSLDLLPTSTSGRCHPPPDMKLPGELRHLVIYGDDAHNPTFHHVLSEALLNAQSPAEQTRNLVRDWNVTSSVFDGPAHTAHAAHVHMTTINFEMRAPSAFGCKWRSRLYSKGRTEL